MTDREPTPKEETISADVEAQIPKEVVLEGDIGRFLTGSPEARKVERQAARATEALEALPQTAQEPVPGLEPFEPDLSAAQGVLSPLQEEAAIAQGIEPGLPPSPGLSDVAGAVGQVALPFARAAAVGEAGLIGGTKLAAGAAAISPPPLNLVTVPIGFIIGAAGTGALTNSALEPIENELLGVEDDSLKSDAIEGAFEGLIGATVARMLRNIGLFANSADETKKLAAARFAKALGVKARKFDSDTEAALIGLMDDGFFDAVGVHKRRGGIVLGGEDAVKDPALRQVLGISSKSITDLHTTLRNQYVKILNKAIDQGDEAISTGGSIKLDFTDLSTFVNALPDVRQRKAAIRIVTDKISEFQSLPASKQNFSTLQKMKVGLYANARFNVTGIESAQSKARRYTARKIKEAIEDNYERLVKPPADKLEFVKSVNTKLSHYEHVIPIIEPLERADRFDGAISRFVDELGRKDALVSGLTLGGTARFFGAGSTLQGTAFATGALASAALETRTAKLAVAQALKAKSRFGEALKKSLPSLTSDPAAVGAVTRMAINANLMTDIEKFSEMPRERQLEIISALSISPLTRDNFEPPESAGITQGLRSVVGGVIHDPQEQEIVRQRLRDTIESTTDRAKKINSLNRTRSLDTQASVPTPEPVPTPVPTSPKPTIRTLRKNISDADVEKPKTVIQARRTSNLLPFKREEPF